MSRWCVTVLFPGSNTVFRNKADNAKVALKNWKNFAVCPVVPSGFIVWLFADGTEKFTGHRVTFVHLCKRSHQAQSGELAAQKEDEESCNKACCRQQNKTSLQRHSSDVGITHLLLSMWLIVWLRENVSLGEPPSHRPWTPLKTPDPSPGTWADHVTGSVWPRGLYAALVTSCVFRLCFEEARARCRFCLLS